MSVRRPPFTGFSRILCQRLCPTSLAKNRGRCIEGRRGSGSRSTGIYSVLESAPAIGGVTETAARAAHDSVFDCATFTVEEAAKILGISRGLGYELVRSGELPSLKLGRRVVPQTRPGSLAGIDVVGCRSARCDKNPERLHRDSN
jgi:excisionase family DNA binding protein